MAANEAWLNRSGRMIQIDLLRRVQGVLEDDGHVVACITIADVQGFRKREQLLDVDMMRGLTVRLEPGSVLERKSEVF